MEQDLFFQETQLGTRLNSKIHGKHVPETTVDGKRVGLSSGSIQGAYQEAVHLLIKWALADLALHRREYFLDLAHDDHRLGPCRHSALTFPLERRCFVLDPVPVDISEEGAPPKVDGRSQCLPALLNVISVACLAN